jgi:hypothetical protein
MIDGNSSICVVIVILIVVVDDDSDDSDGSDGSDNSDDDDDDDDDNNNNTFIDIDIMTLNRFKLDSSISINSTLFCSITSSNIIINDSLSSSSSITN